VIDASDPDRDRHIEAVGRVLVEIDAQGVASIDVFNKCDRLTGDELARLSASHPAAVRLSAVNGAGLDTLVSAVTRRLALETQRVTLEFDEGDEDDRQRIARLYRHARVRSHEAVDGRVSIEADVPRRLLARLTSGDSHP